MARLLVSKSLIEERLFPGSSITVADVKPWDFTTVVMEVTGPEIPKVDWIEMTVHNEGIRYEAEPIKPQKRHPCPVCGSGDWSCGH